MGIEKNAHPLRIVGVPNGQLVYLEYTVSSGTVTAVRAPSGWSLGNFTAGVAALTFPTHHTVFFAFDGHENTDNANATSRHKLLTKDIVAASGTAVIRSEDGTGTTENPVDGTIRLLYAVGD